MNKKFYRNVLDYMPELLPKPRKKKPMEDGVEIPIIHVLCEGPEW